jgi:hypothetical protein
MPRKANGKPGDLEQAMALLIQNQASFLSTFLTHSARTDERFARIESELDQIKAILLRHERILNELPEAIRQKVGFKAQ